MGSDSFVAVLLAEPEERLVNRPARVLPRALLLRLLPLCEFMAEFFTCMTVITMASAVLHHAGLSIAHSPRPWLTTCTVAAVLASVLFWRRAIDLWTRLNPIHETATVVRICLGMLAVLLIVDFIPRLSLRAAPIAVGIFLLPLALALQKRLGLCLLRRLQDSGHGIERVIICGGVEQGRSLSRILLASPHLALRPLAVIGIKSFRTEGEWNALNDNLRKIAPFDLLMIVDVELSSEQQIRIATLAMRAGAHVVHIHEDGMRSTALPDSKHLRQLLCPDSQDVVTSRAYEISKRMVDVVGSVLLLLLLSPVLIVIALLVRLSSEGPAFFVQQRVGRGGELFRMYKFRSMHVRTNHYRRSPTDSRDPRITCVGRILRRTSLDELPQLINVFLGQMSLVGPRPEMPFIARHYNRRQRQRLRVTPGLTGLWQLSSDRSFPIHENLHHDLSYIDRRTLSLDFAILIHTLLFAMHGGV